MSGDKRSDQVQVNCATKNTTTTGDKRSLIESAPRKQQILEDESEVTRFLCRCNCPDRCITLKDILKTFNAPISEEQAWAFIFQTIRLYRDAYEMPGFRTRDLRDPADTDNLNFHNDGSVHINCSARPD